MFYTKIEELDNMESRMPSGHNSGQKKEKKRYQITTDDIIKQIKHGTLVLIWLELLYIMEEI